MEEQAQRRIMRWWPLLFSLAWITWAIIAPRPWFAGWHLGAHIVAGLGAFGLVCMAFFPWSKYVRLGGTLLAITYPLNRAIALVFDDVLDTRRQIVAISFSLVVVLSLLLLYPTLWWVSKRKEFSNGP